jgi:hypothetical protein
MFGVAPDGRRRLGLRRDAPDEGVVVFIRFLPDRLAVDAWLSARWNEIVRLMALHSTAVSQGVATMRSPP